MPQGPLLTALAVPGSAGCDGGTAHHQLHGQIHLPGTEAGTESE